MKNSLGMYDYLKGVFLIIIMASHTYGLDDIFGSANLVGRGILLVIVLLGQAAMPAFFVMSGYGFRKTTFQKCLKKQIKTLIVPYVITMIAAAFVNVIGYHLLYGADLYGTLAETKKIIGGSILGLIADTTIFGVDLKTCGPAWFLLALAIGNILFNTLLKFFKDKKLLLISALISIGGWGLSVWKIWPWCISQGLLITFYLCVGYFAKKKKLFTDDAKRQGRIWFAIIISVLAIAVLATGGGFNINLNVYSWGPVSVIVLGGFSLVVLYGGLLLNKFSLVKKSHIRKIGRNSLYVFCIHTVEFVGIGSYLQYEYVIRSNSNVWVRTLIIIVARIFVVLGATLCFKRAKSFIGRSMVHRRLNHVG